MLYYILSDADIGLLILSVGGATGSVGLVGWKWYRVGVGRNRNWMVDDGRENHQECSGWQ